MFEDEAFVRNATLADAPGADAILYTTLRLYGIEPDRGETAFVLREPAVDLVAQIDEELVGLASMRPDGHGGGWVSKLFVDADYRRLGVGRMLLDALVAEARKRGWKRLQLSTRRVFKEAIALYESSGWTRGPALPMGGLRRRELTYFLDL